MPDFDWTAHDQAVLKLRALGCAVITITPMDVQALTDDEDDEPAFDAATAHEWMSLHSDDVEEALLGDYWGDTIRDLLSVYPTEASDA